MGQSQSQQNTGPTPEPLDPVEAARLREEEETQRAEDRARRAAAAEQRLAATQQRKTGAAKQPGAGNTALQKKESALEQMSRENRRWRDADNQADLRAWN